MTLSLSIATIAWFSKNFTLWSYEKSVSVNLSPYCGFIVDAKIRASDKDLPVQTESEVCDCNHQKDGGEWKSLF